MAKRKIDEHISYNGLFFLLAVLFALATFWAVYDETVTRREWKQYQERFFVVDAEVAQAELARQEAYLDVAACPVVCWDDAVAAACGPDAGPKCLKRLERKRKRITKECEQVICAPAVELRRLESVRAELEQSVRSPAVRSEIAEVEAELAAAALAEQEQTQTWTFTKAEWSEQDYLFRTARHAHLANPDDPQLEASFQRQLAAFDQLAQRAQQEGLLVDQRIAERKAIEQRLAKVARSGERKELVNALEAITKLRDEAARKHQMALGRASGRFGAQTGIIQYNLPSIGRVDRCSSCHLASTRGGLEAVAEPEFRSHPLRRTLLGLHPPEDFGCTSCHDGQGKATTKFFAHAPSKDEDPQAFHQHYWEWPLLTGPPGGDGTEYMESKCRGCHPSQNELRATVRCEHDAECASLATSEPGDAPDVVCAEPAPVERAAAQHAFDTLPGTSEQALPVSLPPPPKLCVDRRKQRPVVVDLAPNYSAGEQIVREAGCYGCHAIAGFEQLPKPGPSLTLSASKLEPNWMVAWIQNPKLHRPNTSMPSFWPELEQPELYPYAIDVAARTQRRSREALAMAAFLLNRSATSSRYSYQLEELPAGLVGDVARGSALFTELGCTGCHTHPTDPQATPARKNRASHFDHGSDLRDIGAKASREWIFSWIRNPQRYAPRSRMPNMRLAPNEALDLATYLSTLRGDQQLPQVAPQQLRDAELIATGEQLAKKYGCFGCHLVEGYEQEPGSGADLSAFGVKLPERLDFGDYIVDHHRQTWDNWTINKLRHPRVYSYNSKAPVETVMPESGLTEDEIRKVMVFLRSNRGESELAATVLRQKLNDKEALRERGLELVRLYNCYGCHEMIGRRGELADHLMAAPDDPNVPNSLKRPPPLVQQGFKTQPAWLFNYLKNPFRMRPQTLVRMPTFGLTDQEANALVAMFSALDDVAYPFAFYGDARPSDEAQYRIGRGLFQQAACQSCHVVGALGAGPMPLDLKAPDLLMAVSRLRPQWLDLWLADPAPLQPMTAMPSAWGGGNQMEMFMADPEFTKELAGIDPELIRTYLSSPQAQIRALRNYLFRMDQPGPAAADKPAQ